MRAVDRLSLTVKRGDCFGSLGVSRAGKTTAFSMLAEEFEHDSGRVYIERNIVLLTESLIELTELSKKVAKLLSGASKRKLYLAMSLIGNASLLALDEPMAGVNPKARHNVSALLRSVRRQNKTSIVVSSHVMEECEAICSRMAIMARGRLRCLGTLLHLRSKFSQSCTIRVQFAISADGNGDLAKDNIVSELQTQLENELSGSSLKLVDTNFNSATFSLSGNKLRRSILFNIFARIQEQASADEVSGE